MTVARLAALALRLNIALIRFGLTRCLVLSLAVIAATMWVWLGAVVLPAGDALNAALAQTKQALRQQPIARPTVGDSAAAQNLKRFYEVLGDTADTEAYLKTLFSTAAAIDLELKQGEYRWEFDAASHVWRHQILLPVKGGYSEIRQFCEKTLRTLPFASLDDLSFKRETIGEAELESSLRFTLYLKQPPRKPKGASS